MCSDSLLGRVDEDMNIPFGAVVKDAKGARWVFVGWYANTAGKYPLFAKEGNGTMQFISPYTPWFYHCSRTETLLRVFPGLSIYLKPAARIEWNNAQ